MSSLADEEFDKGTLSLQQLVNFDKVRPLSELLGVSPVKAKEERQLNSVKTLQCGEFKYPDVSSPLGKILGGGTNFDRRSYGSSMLDYNSPRPRRFDSYGPIRGGVAASPYNPSYDEVFMMNNRTPDASPFRQRPNHYRCGADQGRSHSPESDVGYGTSFGSQDIGGGTVDMDILSNIVRSLSLTNGSRASVTRPSASLDSPVVEEKPFDPFAITSSNTEPTLDENDVIVSHDSFATDSSKDDSISESDQPPLFQATVGPRLVELDPAVAHASQKYQPFSLDDGFENFTNCFSPKPNAHISRGIANIALESTMSLEKVAKLHRTGAAYYDASCTWRGQLPPRNHANKTLSVKVFLGGVPWDITEHNLIAAFRPFGPIRIEWPGKEGSSIPKGYLYVIFEHERQVRHLLSACTQDFGSGTGSWYFKVSSKRMRHKEVQVIPWVISDSAFVRCPSARLDSGNTVFVGALHGMLSAEGVANIFQDLFKGVVYAGIDTDKHKYPIGSGRVVFNNMQSYMKAVSAAFIEIKTTKFTKKIQVDPYLEDALCCHCSLRQGPYYCRDLSCFKYYCRSCWDSQHSIESLCHHKPIMRNSRGTPANKTVNRAPHSSNSFVALPQLSPFEF